MDRGEHELDDDVMAHSDTPGMEGEGFIVHLSQHTREDKHAKE
jgi:hypothetical protein